MILTCEGCEICLHIRIIIKRTQCPIFISVFVGQKLSTLKALTLISFKLEPITNTNEREMKHVIYSLLKKAGNFYIKVTLKVKLLLFDLFNTFSVTNSITWSLKVSKRHIQGYLPFTFTGFILNFVVNKHSGYSFDFC